MYIHFPQYSKIGPWYQLHYQFLNTFFEVQWQEIIDTWFEFGDYNELNLTLKPSLEWLNFFKINFNPDQNQIYFIIVFMR